MPCGLLWVLLILPKSDWTYPMENRIPPPQLVTQAKYKRVTSFHNMEFIFCSGLAWKRSFKGRACQTFAATLGCICSTKKSLLRKDLAEEILNNCCCGNFTQNQPFRNFHPAKLKYQFNTPVDPETHGVHHLGNDNSPCHSYVFER